MSEEKPHFSDLVPNPQRVTIRDSEQGPQQQQNGAGSVGGPPLPRIGVQLPVVEHERVYRSGDADLIPDAPQLQPSLHGRPRGVPGGMFIGPRDPIFAPRDEPNSTGPRINDPALPYARFDPVLPRGQRPQHNFPGDPDPDHMVPYDPHHQFEPQAVPHGNTFQRFNRGIQLPSAIDPEAGDEISGADDVLPRNPLNPNFFSNSRDPGTGFGGGGARFF